MPLPEGLSPPLLIALAAVWCRLVYALCTPNLTGALVALATVAAWRWAVQLKRRRTETVVQTEAAPTPEVAVEEKAQRAAAAGMTVEQLDEKALDDEALNTIQRCAKLATNDSEDESVEGGFRLVLTFDLAVTPSEAFAKFWENDYYARVLEEKCNNEDVTFEPWRNGHPKTRKVNTRHPLAKDISMPGISFSIPTAKIQRVFFDVEDMAFCIVEESRFEKIPYARALAVETVWLFERKGSSIFGRVYYRCVFDTTVLSVPKWIQSYCNAHTREELIVTYGHWISAARELLEAETGVRSARMVDTPREAPPPSWAGVPTNGWDDVFPETKRFASGVSFGFDSASHRWRGGGRGLSHPRRSTNTRSDKHAQKLPKRAGGSRASTPSPRTRSRSRPWSPP